MKKILAVLALAITVLAVTPQQAQAHSYYRRGGHGSAVVGLAFGLGALTVGALHGHRHYAYGHSYRYRPAYYYSPAIYVEQPRYVYEPRVYHAVQPTVIQSQPVYSLAPQPVQDLSQLVPGPGQQITITTVRYDAAGTEIDRKVEVRQGPNRM